MSSLSKAEASKQERNVQKALYNACGEAYRTSVQRFDDFGSLRSIFKRRGNKSGTVDAVEQALFDIIQREEFRKMQEADCLKTMLDHRSGVFSENLTKYVVRMGQKILVTCKKKGGHLNFPFPCSDYQVQEIMNAEEPETLIYDQIMEGNTSC